MSIVVDSMLTIIHISQNNLQKMDSYTRFVHVAQMWDVSC